MYLKIQGLVLRVTKYNDKDALLTVLTHNHGKITAKARGLLRKNSPLTAPCQLLAYSEFTLFEYKGFYTVNEASTVEMFHGLRKDLTKLSLGTYFAQVADVISQEDIPNPELLSLTLNCLYGLSRLQLPENQIKAAFELRIACIAGYTPDLDGCQYCGNPVPDRFNITQGRVECKGCRDWTANDIRMPLSPGALDGLRYLAFCDPKRLFSFRTEPATMEEMAQVTESYLCTQLERGFSTLDFYKSLLIPADLND